MRRLIIVLVVLAMMLLIAVPLLADVGCWQALASGGKWRGTRDVDAPGALNRTLDRNDRAEPWLKTG